MVGVPVDQDELNRFLWNRNPVIPSDIVLDEDSRRAAHAEWLRQQ